MISCEFCKRLLNPINVVAQDRRICTLLFSTEHADGAVVRIVALVSATIRVDADLALFELIVLIVPHHFGRFIDRGCSSAEVVHF